MSGSGITWAICKSAPRSRQITTPAPHHSVLYGPSLPPTNSVNALKVDMCSRNLQIMTAAMFSTKHAGFPLSWLQKIPGLFQDLRSIFPGPCRKRAMFKYRDKQQLLNVWHQRKPRTTIEQLHCKQWLQNPDVLYGPEVCSLQDWNMTAELQNYIVTLDMEDSCQQTSSQARLL